MTATSPATAHVWKFFRIGGFDQVAIETGADLVNLGQLDQKLWVALSCPVKGLEIDEKTLALIDTDKDGRIRVPELLAAIRWAAAHLKDPGVLLNGRGTLSLSAFDDTTPAGQAVLASARRILTTLGKSEAGEIALADAADTARLFAATKFNGDGIITPDTPSESDLRNLIADIVSVTGGVTDRNGGSGVDRARIATFFADATAYATWSEQGTSPAILTFGSGTAAALSAVQAVRAKIDDYFSRIRLAAYDGRALAALNRSETDYLALAAQDLSISATEVSGFPLARIEIGKPLPLLDQVNPAWAAALATLHKEVITPVFGPDRVTLDEAGWTVLKAKIAPFEAWTAAKAGLGVEKLGLDRLKAILSANRKEDLFALVAQDKALEPEFNAIASVEQLLRFSRDLRTLVQNFVNFFDFYSPNVYAVFQAGVLYLDSRSTEFCLTVTDPAAHSTLASQSNVYIAYCDLRRVGGETLKIAACFTQGDSDYLRVGRNGIFYDRKGRDWDASITKIVDHPISIRQAFWSPYKKVARFVEDQIAKFAAAKEKAADASLAAGVAATATAPAAARPGSPAFDIAKFAGIFAAIGLALGTIGGALAAVATGFMQLVWWQMPLAVTGALLVVSGPSMLLAALKLRQRTVGPLLDANGWAINGRVKINIPFGTKLTERALLPVNAKVSFNDPYADKAALHRRQIFATLVVLILIALGAARFLDTWPFHPAPAVVATPDNPA